MATAAGGPASAGPLASANLLFVGAAIAQDSLAARFERNPDDVAFPAYGFRTAGLRVVAADTLNYVRPWVPSPDPGAIKVVLGMPTTIVST